MKLLKENSYEIVKLFINQVGITIFSLVLYTGLNFSADTNTSLKITLFLSVFATLFYLVLLYFAGWEYGSKDKIRIDSGKYKAMPLKGLLLSVYANMINFVLALISVVFFAIFMGGGSEVFKLIAGVCETILGFITAMFLGIINNICAGLSADDTFTHFIRSLCYGLFPLLGVFATQLGYSLGLKNIKISDLFKAKPQIRRGDDEK